jgi:hypothetical protein
MSDTPPEITIAMQQLRDLAVECWRLRRVAESAVEPAHVAGLRRIARSLADILGELGVEIVDFSGRNYDVGFVAEVIDVHEEEGMSQDQAVIEETVVPTLLWRGHVVDAGQIVVKRAPRTATQPSEVEP